MSDKRPLSAVILAGGRSSRFGRDKLAEPLDGSPLLDHAVAAVRSLAEEVIVVAAPGADLAIPDAQVVHDPAPFEGPLAGTMAGLGAASCEEALVVGGDMPTLVAAVLQTMIAALDDPAIAAVVLEHEGRARPLPLAVRREAGLNAGTALIDGGERRLRALIETLFTRVIPEDTWRRLDPAGATLRDVDTPADLP